MTPTEKMAIEAAIGGAYEMPDGRKFWIDAATAKEMTRRVCEALPDRASLKDCDGVTCAAAKNDGVICADDVCDQEVGLLEFLTGPPRAYGVPPGWKLVPIEPTDGMIQAAHKSGVTARNNPVLCWDEYEAAWKSMLAEAPAPQSTSEPTPQLRDPKETLSAFTVLKEAFFEPPGTSEPTYTSPWQPAETAPKDGTKIDGWFVLGTSEHAARWADIQWLDSLGGGYWMNGPNSQHDAAWRLTHWMLPPAVPTSGIPRGEKATS